jgi:hypothetical protein
LIFVAALAVSSRARAWVEVHVAGDDVRLLVDRAGAARVEHRITLKISGGPLRAFDIRGVDSDAVLDPDGYVAPFREGSQGSLASAIPVTTEMLPEGMRAREDGRASPPTLRVRFDTEKGLRRGTYTLLVRYKTDLMARGLIKLDGAMGTVTWRGPAWDDGLDSARATFELPSAPTPPRTFEASVDPHDESAPPPPSVLSTVRRGTERDEIELIRTYAPKGEPIVWAVRVDARAFRAAPEAASRPSLALPEGAGELLTPERRPTFMLALGAGLFLLFSVLVALKAREAMRLARAAGTEARPLLRMPLFLRSAGAGGLLTSGIALELTMRSPTVGAALVALATALAAHRTPLWSHTSSLRKPGRWLPVAEREAFRAPPRRKGAYLDVSTREGKGILLALLGAIGAGAAVMWRTEPYYAYLIALDATPLLAIFCTGRMRELPPDPAAAPAGFLRDVAKRVQRLLRAKGREQEARAIGRVRVPDGSPDADELRLGIVPKAPIAGFLGIEVGVVYVPGAGGAIEMPEVLLRVAAGSPCEEAMAELMRHGKSMRGRRPNEKVVLFTPRLPTARMTAGIAAALVRGSINSAASVGAAKAEEARPRARARAGKQAAA